MKIGIIGSGHIGGTLARRLSALGHDVSIANSRGPETLVGLAAETGVQPVTVRDAAHGKELVIIAIPEKSIRDLPKDLFASGDRTVVVDTGNYYPKRDGRIAAIEDGTPESQWVAQQLGRPVVKAFNTIYAQHLLERGRAADQTGTHRPSCGRRRLVGQSRRATGDRRVGFRWGRCWHAGGVLAATAGHAGLRQRSERRQGANRAGFGAPRTAAGVQGSGKELISSSPSPLLPLHRTELLGAEE